MKVYKFSYLKFDDFIYYDIKVFLILSSNYFHYLKAF